MLRCRSTVNEGDCSMSGSDNAVKSSDVTVNPFEWLLGENSVSVTLLHCIRLLCENIAGKGY